MTCIYQGDESHDQVVELREAAHCLAAFLDDEIGMDKTELTRLWSALKPFGFDRVKREVVQNRDG